MTSSHMCYNGRLDLLLSSIYVLFVLENGVYTSLHLLDKAGHELGDYYSYHMTKSLLEHFRLSSPINTRPRAF